MSLPTVPIPLFAAPTASIGYLLANLGLIAIYPAKHSVYRISQKKKEIVLLSTLLLVHTSMAHLHYFFGFADVIGIETIFISFISITFTLATLRYVNSSSTAPFIPTTTTSSSPESARRRVDSTRVGAKLRVSDFFISTCLSHWLPSSDSESIFHALLGVLTTPFFSSLSCIGFRISHTSHHHRPRHQPTRTPHNAPQRYLIEHHSHNFISHSPPTPHSFCSQHISMPPRSLCLSHNSAPTTVPSPLASNYMLLYDYLARSTHLASRITHNPRSIPAVPSSLVTAPPSPMQQLPLPPKLTCRPPETSTWRAPISRPIPYRIDPSALHPPYDNLAQSQNLNPLRRSFTRLPPTLSYPPMHLHHQRTNRNPPCSHAPDFPAANSAQRADTRPRTKEDDAAYMYLHIQ
ncbi:hypothetical protein R3P38DRAFT_3620094 [Favolaschia claudopus]|uniref:Vomeronasal type-1 receptor n=1 Tax=Favolaschia claudopus TaxID=2862362 RepID=A0AAW0DCH6_9AGAR